MSPTTRSSSPSPDRVVKGWSEGAAAYKRGGGFIDDQAWGRKEQESASTARHAVRDLRSQMARCSNRACRAVPHRISQADSGKPPGRLEVNESDSTRRSIGFGRFEALFRATGRRGTFAPSHDHHNTPRRRPAASARPDGRKASQQREQSTLRAPSAQRGDRCSGSSRRPTWREKAQQLAGQRQSMGR